MMKSALLSAIAISAALGLAACEQQMERGETYPVDQPPVEAAEIPQQVTPQAAPQTRKLTVQSADIDWVKAREDMAARPVDEDSASSFQVASGPEAPPVPVLLPQLDMAGTASTDPADQPRFQPLKDGYFAAYPGETYDIIVNGTNQVLGADASDGEYAPRYLATSAGAQIAFSKYGADYLVEFECNEISGADGTCIEEADALKIAQELIIAGSR